MRDVSMERQLHTGITNGARLASRHLAGLVPRLHDAGPPATPSPAVDRRLHVWVRFRARRIRVSLWTGFVVDGTHPAQQTNTTQGGSQQLSAVQGQLSTV